MIKHLRFFMLNLLVLVSAAVMAQTTIDFTKLTWSNPLVQSPYTFSADKNSGSTAPTQNPNSKDIRLYAKNSLTISTSSGKICKIVFHISTNGLKQWADFTPNNGSVTVSKEKQTATWENAEGATSVTFTVGAKCKYGTAATTKAGQFFFNSVDITELGGTSSTSTSLTFGADVDGKTFVVREGDSFADKTATVTPTDAKGSISYASDNEEAISVNPTTGAVSFLAFGKYTNEAPLFDGFKPTIKDEAGNELNLPVKYSSSNTDFCMVTGSGTVLLSQNPGEVTITAKFAGNDDYLPAQASYLIKVIKKEKKDAGISFEDTMIMIDLANPNTTVKDLGFLNPNNLAVTYSSNKTDVAEVDTEGNVTLKKAGRVNIDVTFAGNDEYKAASASCTLIVNDYRTTPELSFDQEEYTANMREGNTFSGATLYNELEVAPLSYTSSNEEVAEVAANGVVILRSTGETTITVWFAGDKNFKAASASYKLKVVDEVVNGIQNITIDNMPEDAKVYNLNGQRVNTKALKSGVYVVNGKKVVLK